MAFHCLDEDEEVHFFDTINTKAKGIGSSLSKYLRRNSDELSWVATELLVRTESPFSNNGSVLGKRTSGRHITLQNLYKILQLLSKDPKISILKKEEQLAIALTYFISIKDTFPKEWLDYKGHRLIHIVCLDALSIAGSKVIPQFISEKKQIDFNAISKTAKMLRGIDWSINGSLKYLKGMSGSRTLAEDLKNQMLHS